MSLSDFDPTAIDSSSEEVLPQKREREDSRSMHSNLPDPLDLLKSFKNNEKFTVKKKFEKKPAPISSIISKPPVVRKSETNEIEQYDYFANEKSAILDNWKSPQEIPDPYQKIDTSKFIKNLNLKKKKPQDITEKLERELARREKAKSGWKRWKKDEEVKMKQQYDS